MVYVVCLTHSFDIFTVWESSNRTIYSKAEKLRTFLHLSFFLWFSSNDKQKLYPRSLSFQIFPLSFSLALFFYFSFSISLSLSPKHTTTHTHTHMHSHTTLKIFTSLVFFPSFYAKVYLCLAVKRRRQVVVLP